VVAIKIVDLEHFQDGNMDDIRKEINIMSSCRHKNVVSYFVSFIDDSDLWLVMPLLGAGSLSDVIQVTAKNGIKDEALIATILKQTLEGL
jgi:serine/threonine protein kinase